jgi:hypothetical protein
MSRADYISTVGTFECIVQKPEAGWFGESKEKKTPFIRIPVKVIEGPYAGQRATYSAWLTDAIFDKTIARLAEVFGFDGDLTALHTGKITFAGMKCSITTEAETYEGKTKIKVAWLNRPGGSTPKPMEETKVQSILTKLTARGKAIAKAAKAAAGITVAPTAPAPAAPDDDVPF